MLQEWDHHEETSGPPRVTNLPTRGLETPLQCCTPQGSLAPVSSGGSSQRGHRPGCRKCSLPATGRWRAAPEMGVQGRLRAGLLRTGAHCRAPCHVSLPPSPAPCHKLPTLFMECVHMNWKFLESLTTPDDIPLIIGENPCPGQLPGLTLLFDNSGCDLNVSFQYFHQGFSIFLSWMLPCWGGDCPVHLGILTSTLGPYPLDASSTLPCVTTKNVSRRC